MDTLDAMIYADSMTVLKLPTGLRRSILALYVVMVHRLHAENPNAVSSQSKISSLLEHACPVKGADNSRNEKKFVD